MISSYYFVDVVVDVDAVADVVDGVVGMSWSLRLCYHHD